MQVHIVVLNEEVAPKGILPFIADVLCFDDGTAASVFANKADADKACEAMRKDYKREYKVLTIHVREYF